MLRPKNKKFKVAIISLTSCDGCQVALLDLGQRFLELFKKIDCRRFNLLQDKKFDGHYDLAFVEGNPTSEEQIKILKITSIKSTKFFEYWLHISKTNKFDNVMSLLNNLVNTTAFESIQLRGLINL